MPAASDDEIRVPAAAKLLALESRTVRELIERGVLHAEVTYGHDCSKLRRSFHLTRRNVDDFLERARVEGWRPAAPAPNWTQARYG